MKIENQHAAIAKAFPKRIGLSSSGAWMWEHDKGGWCCCYPDNSPLCDLNAFHCAWKTLTLAQRDQYESALYDVIVGQAEYHRNDDAHRITNATAEQRWEALLRFLDLWVDEESEPAPEVSNAVKAVNKLKAMGCKRAVIYTNEKSTEVILLCDKFHRVSCHRDGFPDPDKNPKWWLSILTRFHFNKTYGKQWREVEAMLLANPSRLLARHGDTFVSKPSKRKS